MQRISREQSYIDDLKPEFNINPTAGSLLGYKHIEETITKMSEAQKGENNQMFGRSHSIGTLEKLSEANKSGNNPMYEKTHSAEI